MEVESTERISKDVRKAISSAGREGALQGAGNILYLDWVVAPWVNAFIKTHQLCTYDG